MPDHRINIHEGIRWKDADGREFQAWDVYEQVREERDRLFEENHRHKDALHIAAGDRDRYRDALERIADPLGLGEMRQIAQRALEGSR